MIGDGLTLARYRRLESRTASFENPTGAKGQAGKTASILGPGRKGSAWRPLAPGKSLTLLDTEGPGQIRHIWMTLPHFPFNLRGCVLRAWWDGNPNPSVECPVGDFFGMAHGRVFPFFNAMQAMQEGTGLNAYFPMPFAKHARITITNESDRKTDMVFYYIDYTLGDPVDDDTLRFHAAFRRENPTTLTKDFQILPKRHGRGRFLGCTVGARVLAKDWWGEGEFKVYLDGDEEFPTIAGTGTEDYLCSAWGLGQHWALYGGAPFVASSKDSYKLVSFYRFHVPDPVYFHKDIRVEAQQIGLGFYPHGRDLAERQDDWSAAAFWYQDGNEPLAPMPDYAARVADLEPVEGEPVAARPGWTG